MTEKINAFTKRQGKDFRLLVITDLHFACTALRRGNDKLAEEAIRKTVEKAKPDLIIANGDLIYPMFVGSFTTNNKKQAKRVSAVMESLNLPWAFVYGNHDEERYSKLDKKQLSQIYKEGKNCLFQEGPEGIGGVGNYYIDLRNEDGAHNTTFFLMDSNAYLGKGFFSGSDHLHAGQLDWYKNKVKELSGKEGKLINSLLFCHIPIKEFKEAWTKCWHGDKDVTYHCGFVQEKDNYFGYPKKIETGLFDAVLEAGSTKGLFFGHDHYNNISLTYKGVRMTYPMSIDYTGYIGIKRRKTQRGGSLVTIDDAGKFEVTHLPLIDLP